jgi:hypothetical protein
VTVTTLSSQAFGQDIHGAQRAAQSGPVIITDQGEPAYVLLRHDAYCRLVAARPSMADLLAQRGDEDFEFEPPRFGRGVPRSW